jgi:hypothetical protein
MQSSDGRTVASWFSFGNYHTVSRSIFGIGQPAFSLSKDYPEQDLCTLMHREKGRYDTATLLPLNFYLGAQWVRLLNICPI